MLYTIFSYYLSKFSFELKFTDISNRIREAQDFLICLKGISGLDQEQGQFLQSITEVQKLRKQGQWTQSLRKIQKFENKNGRDFQFEQIELALKLKDYCDKKITNTKQQIRILQETKNSKLMQDSSLKKWVSNQWNKHKQLIKVLQEQFIKLFTKFKQSPQNVIFFLKTFNQQAERLFTDYSYLQTVSKCLLTNSLRMLGKYQQANKILYKLKREVLTSQHPQYYHECGLDRFQQRGEYQESK